MEFHTLKQANGKELPIRGNDIDEYHTNNFEQTHGYILCDPYLYDIHQQAKLICGDSSENRGYLWRG